MEQSKAFDYAIRILSLRDYSTYKMQQKLKERGHDEIEIDETIERLIELNYLREDEYKRIRIKTLLTKGYSDNYIRQKLAEERLSLNSNDIQIIRDEYDISDDEQIKHLIVKKLRYKEIPSEFEAKMKLKRRVMNFLKTKGYDYDLIQRSVSQYF